MKWSHALVLSTVALPLAVLSGCSDAAQFTTRYASDFTHAPHTRVGAGRLQGRPHELRRLGADRPGAVGPARGKCGAGYDDARHQQPGAVRRRSTTTRAPTASSDELLDQLGPAATGSHPGRHGRGPRDGQRTRICPTPARSLRRPAVDGGQQVRRGRRHGRQGRHGPDARGATGAMRRPHALADGNAFEMSASLFSVKEHRSVGLVSMGYSGPSVDDAVSKLAARLGVELPGSSCAGWDWSAKVDGQRIRELVEKCHLAAALGASPCSRRARSTARPADDGPSS